MIPKTLALFAILAISLPATGCRFVTDEELARMAAQSGNNFNAETYVGKLWDSKVIPTLESEAVDAHTLIAAIAEDPDAAGKTYGHRAGEGNPWSYEIKGTGKVVSVDTSSRRGLMKVELAGSGDAQTVTLQIGPVVFGTALRDSLPFINFGDFVNQLQFAQISRALNDRAIKDVTASFNKRNVIGKTVTFVGATTVNSASAPLTVTPVVITPGQRGSS